MAISEKGLPNKNDSSLQSFIDKKEMEPSELVYIIFN